KIDLARFEGLRPLVARHLAEAGKRPHEKELVADLAPLARAGSGAGAADEEGEDSEGTEAAPSADEALARQAGVEPLSAGLLVSGVVTGVDDRAKRAEV